MLERLREVVDPIVLAAGCDLVAVEVIGGQRPVVRVSIDRAGGSTIADCTAVTRALSLPLDEADLLPTAFDLEVSTPGIDRPVQREEDFVRFAGCQARLKTWGMDNRRRPRVVLVGARDGMVIVRGEDGEHSIPIADIERCHLILSLAEFKRLGEGLHPIEQEKSP